ncbi:phage/plasmid primase, P4 family [Apilactobacillus micheneri]|uniref:phage/plasmid primase, P4 family n=1 Tax=Apilactobacillus micheneri TaxID=1899430 RepID=UPI001128B71C|nr:phage/plasmid primase, P4 family [Apilactobacillus micheneri]
MLIIEVKEAVTQWQYIQELADKGICMYPLRKGTKKAVFKGSLIEQATSDIETLKKKFKPDEQGKLAYDVAISPMKSNLIIVDIDNHIKTGNEDSSKNTPINKVTGKPHKYGTEWISKQTNNGNLMQSKVMETTPNNGVHHFYINDLDIDIKDGTHIDSNNSIELKTQSTTIYPSDNYKQVKSLATTDIGIMPKWLKDYIKSAVSSKNKPIPRHSSVNQRAVEWVINLNDTLLNGIEQGNRNNKMASITGYLYATGASDEKVHTWLSHINNNYVNPPLKQSELNNIYRSVSKREHGTIIIARPFKSTLNAKNEANKWMNEHKDVKRLPYLQGAEIMLKHFHFVRFSMNENERIAVYVDDSNNSLYGLYTQNYDYIKRLINAMYPIYNIKGINEVLNKIEMLVTNVKHPERTKYLIPVGNGVFNLKTKRLDPYTPNYVFSSKVSTNYNNKYQDDKNIPKIGNWNLDNWLQDLSKDETGNINNQLVKLLWQVIADSLNGNYTRRKAILLNSEHGSSGKGTFQSLITNLVGESNVATLKVNEFSDRFSMARLVGKSVCIGDDNPNGYIKDSSNFNSVITGDVINVEYKGKDSFTAQLTPTVIQSFNGLPHFSNKGGTYRRMLIVPFKQHYQGNTDNWKIKDVYLKRKDVLEYTLFKALNEYSDFEKFDMPDVSNNALNEFEKENDPIKEFVDDEFIKWDVPKITTQALYKAYTRYCKDNGYSSSSKGRFIRRVNTLLPNYNTGVSRISSEDFKELYKVYSENNLLSEIDLKNKGKSSRCLFRL